MARLVPTNSTFEDGRYAVVEGNEIIGYGSFELPFVPRTTDAFQTDVKFVVEPRQSDGITEAKVREAIVQ